MSRTGEARQVAGLPGQDRDGAGHTGSLTVPVRVRWLALCRTAAQLERERAWSQAGRQWYEAMGLAQGRVDMAWCESRYLWCRRCVNEQGITQETRREDDEPLR